MKKISILSILIISIFNSSAWEVDNFTNRDKYFSLSEREKLDNLFILNDQTNRMLHDGIKRMNDKRGCVEDMKRKSPSVHYMVRRILGGGMVDGALEDWAQNNSKLHTVKANQKLYNGIWSVDTSLNLNGHVVGIDKLGHFFDQGHEMFEMAHQSGADGGLKQALGFSNDLEDQYYGISTSGVKSYGDMAANYAGMNFFTNLIDGDDSFLKCNKATGKYEVIRDFDWSDFVDDSWDEGINCSMFYKANNPYSKWLNSREEKNVKMDGGGVSSIFNGDKVFTDAGKALRNSLSKLKISCPVEVNKCKKLASLECANYFVSPDCLKKASAEINSKCEHKNIGEYNVKRTKSGYSYRPTESSSTNSQKQSNQ